MQERKPESVDLRRLTARELGPKRRREVEDEDDVMEAEEQQQQPASEPAEAGPSSKRQKADETTWRPVSGKGWKAPEERASTVMKAQTSKTWGKRMEEKAQRQQLLAIKAEVVAEGRAKRKATAMQRKASKERKMANRAKSEVVQQVSTATVKKMMKNKKQKKLLRKADTN